MSRHSDRANENLDFSSKIMDIHHLLGAGKSRLPYFFYGLCRFLDGKIMEKKIKIRRGLKIIYTGNGKGKTSAALGTVIRAAGYNLKTIMIQFMKGSWHYGEKDGARLLAPFFEMEQMGKGFYKILDDNLPEEEHKKAAAAGVERAIEVLTSGEYDLVILDEINVALATDLVSLDDVRRILDAHPATCHLIMTGRDAHPEVIERADLVTEMKEIKHPYQQGILAQKGIDF